MNIKRVLMMAAVFAVPAGLGHCGFAFAQVPDVPQCYPGDATATEPKLVTHDKGCAYVWYCDIGHEWMQWRLFGNWQECKYFVAIHDYGGLKVLTKAQKDALWRAMPADTGQDKEVRAAVDAQPWNADVPPSGLVTQSTIVYKTQAVTGGGFKMVAVGTIALGKTCNVAVTFKDSTGIYYGLTRADVVMKKIGNYTPPFPNTAYGKCT